MTKFVVSCDTVCKYFLSSSISGTLVDQAEKWAGEYQTFDEILPVFVPMLNEIMTSVATMHKKGRSTVFFVTPLNQWWHTSLKCRKCCTFDVFAILNDRNRSLGLETC